MEINYTTKDNIKYKNNNSIYTNNIFTDLDELFNIILNN